MVVPVGALQYRSCSAGRQIVESGKEYEWRNVRVCFFFVLRVCLNNFYKVPMCELLFVVQAVCVSRDYTRCYVLVLGAQV